MAGQREFSGQIEFARYNVIRYNSIDILIPARQIGMIASFRCSETKQIWAGLVSRKFPPDIQKTGLRKLRMLNSAIVIRDLSIPPKNRLEALRGSRTGQHSIRINDQWRICFVWTTGGPADVEIVDYH